MRGLPRQHTRLEDLLQRVLGGILGRTPQNWRTISLAVLAMLLGFYGGQNLPAALLSHVPGGRPATVLALVLSIEVVVRVRSWWVNQPPSLAWVVVDNLRLGFVYAIVLEAFKLGT